MVSFSLLILLVICEDGYNVEFARINQLLIKTKRHRLNSFTYLQVDTRNSSPTSASPTALSASKIAGFKQKETPALGHP